MQGKVMVVTGGAGAIARPIVRTFQERGAQVVVVDRRGDEAERVAREVGALGLGADLSTAAGAEALVREVLARRGGLDGLIHTVGAFGMGKVAAVDPAEYDRLLDANLRALFYAVRAVLPVLTAKGAGFVAGFSSEPALTGQALGTALYAASKAAVATFLRSLDGELAASGVRVAIVYPMGAVDTPANRRDMPDFPEERYIDPQEIAETLWFAATRGPRARLRDLAVYPGR